MRLQYLHCMANKSLHFFRGQFIGMMTPGIIIKIKAVVVHFIYQNCHRKLCIKAFSDYLHPQYKLVNMNFNYSLHFLVTVFFLIRNVEIQQLKCKYLTKKFQTWNSTKTKLKKYFIKAKNLIKKIESSIWNSHVSRYSFFAYISISSRHNWHEYTMKIYYLVCDFFSFLMYAFVFNFTSFSFSQFWEKKMFVF